MNGVKVQETSLTRMRTRIGAFVLAIIVALSMAAMTPLSAYAAELQISVDKTASVLDENNQSQINLEFTGTTDKTYSDVVFVLDKSTSVDVRKAAKAMVEELLSQAGDNKIKVGVVVFNKNAAPQLQLTELNDANLAEINAALDTQLESGTNIEAGIQTGKAMLDSDTSVASSAKHLVLVTDGVTYLYGTEDTPQTIYSESVANGEESLNAGNEAVSANYMSELTDSATWLNTYGDQIASDIAKYGTSYESGQYKAVDYDVESHQGYDTDWSVIKKFNAGNSYVPAELNDIAAGSNAAGVYRAMTAWQDVVNTGYQAYAYASDKYSTTYPWGAAFVSTLDTIGGTSGMVPSNTTGMFDAVKSDILYALGEGSVVTDVMGSGTTEQGEEYNFDFVNDINKIDISVDGVTLTKTSAGENSYSFGNNGEFTLAYNPSTDSFDLLIYTPIAGNNVVVSYYVELVKAPTITGDYKLNTNNSAILNPAGDFEDSVFPIPTVDYTVTEEPVTPVDPGDSDTGDSNTNNNTQTVNVDTGSDSKASSLPKTSDNILPFAIGLAVIALLAGSAGLVAWRKNR